MSAAFHDSKFLTVFLLAILLLTSCEEKKKRVELDIAQLTLDTHIIIGGERINLPFVALNDYAYRKMSFSLNHERDNEHAQSRAKAISKQVASWETAPTLESISVRLRTYGWSDTASNAEEICPRLSRQWAKAICNNPWAAIQQAVPKTFHLVNLRKLESQSISMRNARNCSSDFAKNIRDKINEAQAIIFCRAHVYPMDGPTKFYTAAIRINNHLGALWRIWEGSSHDTEAKTEMLHGTGKAIKAFGDYAIGESEDFDSLQATLCKLRKPVSKEHPKRTVINCQSFE